MSLILFMYLLHATATSMRSSRQAILQYSTQYAWTGAQYGDAHINKLLLVSVENKAHI